MFKNRSILEFFPFCSIIDLYLGFINMSVHLWNQDNDLEQKIQIFKFLEQIRKRERTEHTVLTFIFNFKASSCPKRTKRLQRETTRLYWRNIIEYSWKLSTTFRSEAKLIKTRICRSELNPSYKCLDLKGYLLYECDTLLYIYIFIITF